MSLSPEGQAGEPSEASFKALLFLKRGSIGHKSTFFRLKRSSDNVTVPVQSAVTLLQNVDISLMKEQIVVTNLY